MEDLQSLTPDQQRAVHSVTLKSSGSTDKQFREANAALDKLDVQAEIDAMPEGENKKAMQDLLDHPAPGDAQ